MSLTRKQKKYIRSHRKRQTADQISRHLGVSVADVAACIREASGAASAADSMFRPPAGTTEIAPRRLYRFMWLFLAGASLGIGIYCFDAKLYISGDNVDFMDFHLKELTLMGCHQPKCPTSESPYYRWTQQHNRRHILKMINDGRLDVERLITHRLPLTEVKDGYRCLREEKDRALGVILTYQD